METLLHGILNFHAYPQFKMSAYHNFCILCIRSDSNVTILHLFYGLDSIHPEKRERLYSLFDLLCNEFNDFIHFSYSYPPKIIKPANIWLISNS